MKSNKVFKKADFLLVEILIAIAIIGLLCIPLIRNPIYLFRSQLTALEKIECERIANLSFLEIKLMFHNNDIPHNLSTDRDHPTIIQLKPEYIDLMGPSKKEIKRSIRIWYIFDKTTQTGDYYRLINIKIDLKPQEFKKSKKSYTYKYKLITKNSL